MRHRAKLKELAKRLEISAYIPPERSVEIAEERTGDMVHYFHALMREASWEEASRYVQLLANSCYLQGITDAAVAMAKMKGRNGTDSATVSQ
jgi:hypothetical protein